MKFNQFLCFFTCILHVEDQCLNWSPLVPTDYSEADLQFSEMMIHHWRAGPGHCPHCCLLCAEIPRSRDTETGGDRGGVSPVCTFHNSLVDEFTLESVNAGQDPCYACWPSLHTTDSATDVWFSLIWMISCELWVLLSQTHCVTSYCTIVLLITECRVVINSDKWICFCQSFMINLVITVLCIWS